MRVWQELYGDDADGNRGVMVDMYEVEDGDKEEVVELLYPYFAEEKITQGLISLTFQDIDIEIEISDYTVELIVRIQEDDDIDNEDKEWVSKLITRNLRECR